MSKIVTARLTALCAGILGVAPFSLCILPMGSVSFSAEALIGRAVSMAAVHRRADQRAYYPNPASCRLCSHYYWHRDGIFYGVYYPYGYGTTFQPWEYGTYQTGNGYGYGMYLPYRFYGYNAYRPY